MHSLILNNFLASIHFSFFFFNDTATTEIYTLSLHDALPILIGIDLGIVPHYANIRCLCGRHAQTFDDVHLRDNRLDRKSTRLNSSHLVISYAVFCLKKKKIINRISTHLPKQTSATLETTSSG